MEINKLIKISNEARKLIIETVYRNKTGHIGGPLSSVDMLTCLYNKIMNISPENINSSNRDRFVLSKGHAAISLYSVLALRGYFPIEELKTFGMINSRLQNHPDMTLLPSLDMSTGSLGQGLSTAVGMALAAKLKNKSFTTYCMIGDGESQEGQIWEAADLAVRYKLDNLVTIMDLNSLQQYGFEGNTINNPIHKWYSFGWNVIYIDGHNFYEIINVLKRIKKNNKPTIIVASTIKGRGVSFMEGEKSWHSRIPTAEEYSIIMKELEALT